MNELIEKLIDEASEIVRNDPKVMWTGGAHYRRVFDRKKFAELIVRECVTVVDGMADPEDSDRYFWAIQNVSQKIKEHFGVKE